MCYLSFLIAPNNTKKLLQSHNFSKQFSPRFLAVLWHAATSLRFASFYGNTARERVALHAELATLGRAPRSIWHVRSKYCHPMFAPH
jgi:hypothetical protein